MLVVEGVVVMGPVFRTFSGDALGIWRCSLFDAERNQKYARRMGTEGGRTEGIRRGQEGGKREKLVTRAREGWGGAREFIGGWGVGRRRADLF